MPIHTCIYTHTQCFDSHRTHTAPVGAHFVKFRCQVRRLMLNNLRTSRYLVRWSVLFFQKLGARCLMLNDLKPGVRCGAWCCVLKSSALGAVLGATEVESRNTAHTEMDSLKSPYFCYRIHPGVDQSKKDTFTDTVNNLLAFYSQSPKPGLLYFSKNFFCWILFNFSIIFSSQNSLNL